MHFEPLKISYVTLGNWVPSLNTPLLYTSPVPNSADLARGGAVAATIGGFEARPTEVNHAS